MLPGLRDEDKGELTIRRPNGQQCRVKALHLEISDPDVVSGVNKYSAMDSGEKQAKGALRLGVLALRQTAGDLDAAAIRNVAQNMLADLGRC